MNRLLTLNSLLKQPKVKTLCVFTVMVFWLYIFPLSGKMIGDSSQFKWFMLTGAITFWGLAHVDLFYLRRWHKQVAVLLLSFLSLAYWYLPQSFNPIILSLCGLCSAVIGAFVATTLAKETVIYAVIGIALGNLFSYVPVVLTLSTQSVIYLACVINLLFWLVDLHPQVADKKPALKHFTNQFGIPSVFYLFPFILFFEILAGIMYSQIWPAYFSAQTLIPGIDLVPYVIALFAGYFIVNKSLLLNLVLAVLAASASFVLWFYAKQEIYIIYTLCFMLLATGFIDVTIIYSAARAEEAYRAYVLLQGSVLFGISLGNFMFTQIDWDYRLFSLVGLIVVNMSLISLLVLHYLMLKNKRTITHPPKQTEGESIAVLEPTPLIQPAGQQQQISLLSEREQRVLKEVLIGKTYKELAEQFDLSESTIKTYMQRIFKKIGVTNLSDLKQKIGYSSKPPN